MSKIAEIFNYMRQCPELANLWSIAATEDDGVNVILPQGASPAVQYQESIDVSEGYEATIEPYPSVYEDYQINCYRVYDANDDTPPNMNINVMSFDEVQAICDWITAQNESGNLPKLTGKKVIAIEALPFIPQIRYVNEQENIIAYFITVRIRYVNPIRRKSVYYELED